MEPFHRAIIIVACNHLAETTLTTVTILGFIGIFRLFDVLVIHGLFDLFSFDFGFGFGFSLRLDFSWLVFWFL